MPLPDRDRHYVAGKGSWRRPEDAEAYRENFDRIFGSRVTMTCGTCAHFGNDWCFWFHCAVDADELRCNGTEYLEG